LKIFPRKDEEANSLRMKLHHWIIPGFA